jgi:hypothetical protein
MERKLEVFTDNTERYQFFNPDGSKFIPISIADIKNNNSPQKDENKRQSKGIRKEFFKPIK